MGKFKELEIERNDSIAVLLPASNSIQIESLSFSYPIPFLKMPNEPHNAVDNLACRTQAISFKMNKIVEGLMRGLYYRRKVALALIEIFGGSLSRTRFQKLLFLATQKQTEKAYDFVPYKFGCFSFQANDDKGALIAKGVLKKDDKNWTLQKNGNNFVSLLKEQDKKILLDLKKDFQSKSQTNLVRYVYVQYPYYATKSEIAAEILTPNELKLIKKVEPKNAKQAFYTIGYEGKSIERYINELVQADIKVLCDVRKNPLSRKFGFSRSQLSDYLKKFGIQYIHIPELGIDSDKRKNLGVSVSHKELFAEYKKYTIPHRKVELLSLVKLLKEHRRIAITCFEADHNCCHRSYVANEIKKLIPNGYEIVNL